MIITTYHERSFKTYTEKGMIVFITFYLNSAFRIHIWRWDTCLLLFLYIRKVNFNHFSLIWMYPILYEKNKKAMLFHFFQKHWFKNIQENSKIKSHTFSENYFRVKNQNTQKEHKYLHNYVASYAVIRFSIKILSTKALAINSKFQ